ncbi:MAG: hypothetical protein II722_05185, partial [Ruminococcus sp.]|nr:hypothetical protein [Ruminococcus sp.]
MFQEIPTQVDIEYDPLPAKDDDSVLCFDGRSVLVRIRDNKAILPSVKELDKKGRCVFVFKADGKRFFLCLEKTSAQGFDFEPLNKIRQVAADIEQ